MCGNSKSEILCRNCPPPVLHCQLTHRLITGCWISWCASNLSPVSYLIDMLCPGPAGRHGWQLCCKHNNHLTTKLEYLPDFTQRQGLYVRDSVLIFNMQFLFVWFHCATYNYVCPAKLWAAICWSPLKLQHHGSCWILVLGSPVPRLKKDCNWTGPRLQKTRPAVLVFHFWDSKTAKKTGYGEPVLSVKTCLL